MQGGLCKVEDYAKQTVATASLRAPALSLLSILICGNRSALSPKTLKRPSGSPKQELCGCLSLIFHFRKADTLCKENWGWIQ